MSTERQAPGNWNDYESHSTLLIERGQVHEFFELTEKFIYQGQDDRCPDELERRRALLGPLIPPEPEEELSDFFQVNGYQRKSKVELIASIKEGVKKENAARVEWEKEEREKIAREQAIQEAIDRSDDLEKKERLGPQANQPQPAPHDQAQTALVPQPRASMPLAPKEREETRYAMIPRQSLKTRYPKAMLGPERRESLQFDQGIETQLPDTLDLSYWEEAVLFGLHVLLSRSHFSLNHIDSFGFFPGSLGKSLFYVPLSNLKELYEAVGLKQKENRNFQDEEYVKASLRSLHDFRFPIVYKRKTRERNENGDYLSHVIIRHEHLIDILWVRKEPSANVFQRRSLDDLWSDLRNLCLIFNPAIINEASVRNYEKLDVEHFKKVEEARRTLAGKEERGWQREPCYLNFIFYLMRQWGKMKKGPEGAYLEIERKLPLFLAKTGLDRLCKENLKYGTEVVMRMLEIYRELGYLLRFDWPRAKDDAQKVRLRLNPAKFSNIRYQLHRFSRRALAS